MELKKVEYDNVWKLLKLHVKPEQDSFVATNTQSIVEAYLALADGYVALPFGIFVEGEPVGFAMFGFGTMDDEDEPKIAVGNYVLWRFMIDERYQGKGYGRKAMELCLDYVKTFPCGKADYCWLSYEPENTVAKKLYKSFGFEENGEMCGDEVVAVLHL